MITWKNETKTKQTKSDVKSAKNKTPDLVPTLGLLFLLVPLREILAAVLEELHDASMGVYENLELHKKAVGQTVRTLNVTLRNWI